MAAPFYSILVFYPGVKKELNTGEKYLMTYLVKIDIKITDIQEVSKHIVQTFRDDPVNLTWIQTDCFGVRWIAISGI